VPSLDQRVSVRKLVDQRRSLPTFVGACCRIPSWCAPGVPRRRSSYPPRLLDDFRPLDPQSVIIGPAPTVTCRAVFGPTFPRVSRSVGVAVRRRCHRRALACKSRASCVPQCARGAPPRRIFGRDVGPFAVVLGSLLHGCYMVGTLPATAGPRRPVAVNLHPARCADQSLSSPTIGPTAHRPWRN
jgi:hypothetical protein